jgi:hypothetical protein
MVENKLCFYLDENVEVALAKQLQNRKIAVVTVRELNLLGKDDLFHLNNATRMGYVLCTYDSDYLQLASEGINHAGIIFGVWDKHSVGDWVKVIEFIHEILTPDDMRNQVEYLSSLA